MLKIVIKHNMNHLGHLLRMNENPHPVPQKFGRQPISQLGFQLNSIHTNSSKCQQKFNKHIKFSPYQWVAERCPLTSFGGKKEEISNKKICYINLGRAVLEKLNPQKPNRFEPFEKPTINLKTHGFF